MVADAAPKAPEASRPATNQTRRLQGVAGRPLPTPTKLRARNLYVVQGLPAQEVGSQVGLTARQVKALADHNGWGKARKAARLALSAPLQAHEEAEIAEIASAQASLADEGALAGLNRAIQAAASDGKDAAKDYQAFAGGARALVQTSRQIRGLDNALGKAAGAAISAIYIRVEDVREAKAVSPAPSPAIDVSATSA